MTVELLSSAQIAAHSGREGVVYQVKDGDGTLYYWDTSTKTMRTVGAGAGIPDGGTTGQVLAKASNDDGDAEWTNAGAGDALTTDPLSQFAATTSDELRGVISDETGTGALVFAEDPTISGATLNGVTTIGGTSLVSASAMAALAVDVTKARNTKTLSGTTATLTETGSASDGQEWGLELTGHTSACVVTLPADYYDAARGTALATFVMPADVKAFISFRRVGTDTYAVGVPTPNVSVFNTGNLAGDDTYEGEVIAGLNAGATIAQWEAVYLDGSSTWQLADANGSGTYPARGLAVAAGTSTNPLTVIRKGTVRNDAWNWTPGGDLYLSGTAGGLTQTAPSTSGDKVQKVGFALTADLAYVDFGTGEYLTVA